jgi:hypothetical protein
MKLVRSLDGFTSLLGQLVSMAKFMRTSDANSIYDIDPSVKGMSFEFVGLNLTGFLFLAVYSTVGYIYPELIVGTVEIQDLCFVYHAIAATLTLIA